MFFFTSNSAQIKKHVLSSSKSCTKAPELQFFLKSFHFSKSSLIKHV